MTRSTQPRPTRRHPVGRFAGRMPALQAAVILAVLGSVFLAEPSPAPGQSAPAATQPSPLPPEQTQPLEGLPILRVEIISSDTRKPLRTDPRLILDQIRAQAGQPYSRAVVDLDTRTIAALDLFQTVSAQVIETPDHKVIVQYIVEERPLISAVEIRGNFHKKDVQIWEIISAKAGSAVDRSEINADIKAIESLYKKDGFDEVRVAVDENLLKNQGIIRYTIVEGPRTEISKILFDGNAHLNAAYLKYKIKSHTHWWIFRKGIINDEDIASDEITIRDLYQSRGYLDCRVSHSIETSPDKTSATLRFIIIEGPRYRVGKINITGNKIYSAQQLMKLVAIAPGDYVDRNRLELSRTHLEDLYGKQGYIYRTVDIRPSYTNATAVVDLNVAIVEGDNFNVGDVIVRGNANTQDRVIRRQIRVYPDQTIDTTLIRKSIERLKATHLFSDVKISPIGDTPRVRDILAEVQEGQTGRFMIGAGISTNAGVVGQVSLEQSNFDILNPPHSLSEFVSGQAFKGAGQYFQILMEPGTQYQQYRIRFEEPYLLDTPYSFANDLYFFTRTRESWDEQRIGDIVTLGRRFGDIWSVTLAFRAEQVSINNVQDNGVIGQTNISSITNSDGSVTTFADSAQEIIDNKGAHFITTIKPGLVRDTTDSRSFPTEGTISGASVEQYGAMGGDATFTKIVTRFNWYQTLYQDLFDRKTVFALRNEVDLIPAGTSVFYERFYGGGIGSLRGFKFRGVSPRSGPLNDPIGGDFAWTTTGEVNYPLYEELLRGVAFVDVGTVERDIEINTIRSDIGVGVRLKLPIFGELPLAVDFAVPLTKASGDRTQIISFSLGIPF